MTIKTNIWTQLLSAVGQLANVATGLVPTKYQGFVAIGIGAIQTIAAIKGHKSNTDGTPLE